REVLALPGARALDAEDLLVDPAALAVDVGDVGALGGGFAAAALVDRRDATAPVEETADGDGVLLVDADARRPHLGDRLGARRDDVDVETGPLEGGDEVALLRVVAHVARDGVGADPLCGADGGGEGLGAGAARVVGEFGG